jgi:hypothetical protein
MGLLTRVCFLLEISFRQLQVCNPVVNADEIFVEMYAISVPLYTELATNRRNRNIRDLYRGVNEFKTGYLEIT